MQCQYEDSDGPVHDGDTSHVPEDAPSFLPQNFGRDIIAQIQRRSINNTTNSHDHIHREQRCRQSSTVITT